MFSVMVRGVGCLSSGSVKSDRQLSSTLSRRPTNYTAKSSDLTVWVLRYMGRSTYCATGEQQEVHRTPKRRGEQARSGVRLVKADVHRSSMRNKGERVSPVHVLSSKATQLQQQL